MDDSSGSEDDPSPSSQLDEASDSSSSLSLFEAISVKRKSNSSKAMPASARKKLDQSLSTPSPSLPNDESSRESSKMAGDKKTGRPMPASVRKKLEELSKSSDLAGGSGSIPESKPKARPMPASAKLKLRLSDSPTSDANVKTSSSASSSSSKPKPMPASARKKLEESSKGASGDFPSSRSSLGEGAGAAIAQKESSSESSTPTSRRPMPASAKRKLDEGKSTVSEAESTTVNKTEEVSKKTDENSTERPRPMPASARRKLEAATNEKEKSETLKDDAVTDKNKVNISLGGIKFPTFAKPMPASVRQKLEAKQESETSQIEENSNSPSKVSKELASLAPQEYACQYCDRLFYSLTKKNNHEKNHLQKVTEVQNRKEDDGQHKSEDAKAPVFVGGSQDSSKSSSVNDKYCCPHCGKRIKDKKKLSSHKSKCGLPFKYTCAYCDKKFKYEKEYQAHVFRHETAGAVGGSDRTCSKVPEVASSSPHVGKSTNSRETSETSKSMPKSVRDRLERIAKEKAADQLKKDTRKEVSSSETKSLKRKIEEVLCSVNSTMLSSDEEMPKKKIILSSEGKGNVRRPMPASAKKKLQESDNQAKTAKNAPVKVEAKPKPPVNYLDDVDDDECEVCHRVFSSSRKRQKHEQSVHFIENPRGDDEEEKNADPSSKERTEAENRKSSSKSETSTAVAAKSFNFRALPSAGTCPICAREIATKLKRHVVYVHFKGNKDAALAAKTMPSSSSAVPPSSAVRTSPLQPLKILSPGYQKTFKINRSNKKKPETITKMPEAEDQVSDGDNDDDAQAVSDLEEEPVPIVPVKSTVDPPKSKLTPANANYKCEKCPDTFLVQADFKEHMKVKHPPEMITRCKLCGNCFSEPMTLILHLKLRHTEEAEGYMNEVRAKVFGSASVQVEEKEPPSPEPDSMDTNSNGDPDYDAEPNSPMDIEDEDDEPSLAITSTFSQKRASPPKSTSGAEESKSLASNLNELPCSSCSEKFYNFEALRKHELIFHNVTTVKMCPICGVYPSRLGRHLIAHENKTVRCFCVPCNSSFNDFGALLKHNLEKHPGPEGGALSASNKPKDQGTEVSTKESDHDVVEESYECIICHKELPGAPQARRHVRRNHEEHENEPADKFIRKVSKVQLAIVEGMKSEDDGAKGPKRPMPASVRARLQAMVEAKSKSNSIASNDAGVSAPASGNDSSKVSPNPRPMPASAKLKLAMKEKEDSSPSTVTEIPPKPSRPMPASVRAKLMASTASAESSPASAGTTLKSTPPAKPNRPMPASARAKLLKSNETTSKADEDSEPEILLESPAQRRVPKDCPPEITISDDDDDDIIVEQDISFPQPEMISIPHDVDTVPIDHDLEIGHEKAVKVVVGGSSIGTLRVRYQCKMCASKYDSRDAARKHISWVHSEYAEHAENLIDTSYEELPEVGSSSSRKYKKSDDEDEEDEVIIPRGTTRRPRGPPNSADSKSSSRTSVPALDQWGFKCKFCDKKFEGPGSVRRHISRAHPQIPASKRDEGVVELEFDNEKELVPAESSPDGGGHSKTHHPASKPYPCEYCTASFDFNADLTEHIAQHFAVDSFSKNDDSDSETRIQIDAVTSTLAPQMESVSKNTSEHASTARTPSATPPAKPKGYRPGPKSKKTQLSLPGSTRTSTSASWTSPKQQNESSSTPRPSLVFESGEVMDLD